MKWSDLTLEEKAGVMNIAVNNGITNLSDIEKLYNSYAEGGNTNKSYEDWSNRLSNYWGEDINKHDYDYQKYYNDNPDEAYRQLYSILNGKGGHFPDAGASGIYKKPSHPTYPDLGDKSWSNNDTLFHLSDRQLLNSDRILDYLGSDLDYNRGGTKAMYNNGYVLPSITVTPNGNYIDLIPNKYRTGFIYNKNE